MSGRDTGPQSVSGWNIFKKTPRTRRSDQCLKAIMVIDIVIFENLEQAINMGGQIGVRGIFQ